jgi:hypothetical protein
VEAIIFLLLVGQPMRELRFGHEKAVSENRFRLQSAAVHIATPRGTRLRSSRFQETEDAVMRREFFVGPGTFNAAHYL